MKAKCPYCGGIYDEPPTIRMSERQKRIYKACAEAGSVGIRTPDLMAHMLAFGEKAPRSIYGQMRVNIYEINRILKGRKQRIMSVKYGRYHLISS